VIWSVLKGCNCYFRIHFVFKYQTRKRKGTVAWKIGLDRGWGGVFDSKSSFKNNKVFFFFFLNNIYWLAGLACS